MTMPAASRHASRSGIKSSLHARNGATSLLTFAVTSSPLMWR